MARRSGCLRAVVSGVARAATLIWLVKGEEKYFDKPGNFC